MHSAKTFAQLPTTRWNVGVNVPFSNLLRSVPLLRNQTGTFGFRTNYDMLGFSAATTKLQTVEAVSLSTHYTAVHLVDLTSTICSPAGNSLTRHLTI